MAEQDAHARLRDEFTRIFPEDGLHDVQERNAILDAFLETDSHVTVQELTDGLAEADVDVDPGRVEQVLELLVRYGIASREHFEGHPTRYEHLHLSHRHDHLICVKCGSIVEISESEGQRFQQLITRRHGFRPFRRRVEIYGLCSVCDRAGSPTHPLSACAIGETVQIAQLEGGAEVEQRLQSMGLRRGMVVEVLQRTERGPIILVCDNARLAIGQDIARRVLVEPAANQELSPAPELPPVQPARRCGRRRWGWMRRGETDA